MHFIAIIPEFSIDQCGFDDIGRIIIVCLTGFSKSVDKNVFENDFRQNWIEPQLAVLALEHLPLSNRLRINIFVIFLMF